MNTSVQTFKTQAEHINKEEKASVPRGYGLGKWIWMKELRMSSQQEIKERDRGVNGLLQDIVKETEFK